MDSLPDELGQAYAQALLAIARVDRELHPEEAARVRELVGRRSRVEVDFEASFFGKLAPDKLAEIARGAGVDLVELGKALVNDGVVLATTDGDLNSVEAHAILRYARALCSDADIGSQTHELDEWL